jgi:hypothetical protein
MNFLPENYESPRMGGQYMKLVQGENRIRILSQPILGWEDWDNRRPIRFRFENKPERPVDPKYPVKHFWAMIVYNYNEAQIQILLDTQANIRKGIESLCKDKDWGAPYFYDVKIIKEGEEMRTKYTVNPMPHKVVAVHIEQAFKEKPIYLDALFDNKDPFDVHGKVPTKGIFSSDDFSVVTDSDSPVVKNIITADQAKELRVLMTQCDPKYTAGVVSTLEKMGFKEYEEISPEIFAKVFPIAKKKAQEYQAEIAFGKSAEVPF